MPPVRGCFQTILNQPQFAAGSVNLFGTKLAPLGESGGTVELEIISAVKGSFLIEMVVNARVDCDKFLHISQLSEAEHGPSSSSKR